MKQSFAENPNLDFLVAGIIHDSFHADQARWGLSFNGDENGRNREKEASAFTLDVAQRIGLSNQVIDAYKRDATEGHLAPPGSIYVKPPKEKKNP